jgi:hypothetical protein
MIQLLISLIFAVCTAEVNQITQFSLSSDEQNSIGQSTRSKYTIVGTAGGWLHAIDSETHKIVWSVDTGNL